MKKFFSSLNFKHIFALTTIVVVLLVVFLPHTTYAQAAASKSWWDTLTGASFSTILLNFGINIIKYLFFVSIQFAALILILAGWFMDFVIKYTVIDMALNIQKITAISVVWKILRDLTNMMFLFVMTYLGISLIIQHNVSNIKKRLTNIVIAALLINFSLFFTKIPIDISNVIALQFYNAIVEKDTRPGLNGVTAFGFDVSQGASAKVMNYLKLQSFYSPKSLEQVEREVAAGSQDFLSDLASTLISGVFSITLMLIASCVFAAVGIMLLWRYFLLIYAMLISPLYWLGFILPEFPVSPDRDYSYIEILKKQCFFAPLFFLYFWISLQIMQQLDLGVNATFSTSALLAKGLTPNQRTDVISNTIGLIIQYSFVMTMMVGSLEVARRTGGAGSDWLHKKVVSLQKAPQNIAAGTGRFIAGSAVTKAHKVAAPTLKNLSAYTETNTRMGKFLTGVGAVRAVKETSRIVDSSLSKAKESLPSYQKLGEKQIKLDREATVALNEQTRKENRAAREATYKDLIGTHPEKIAKITTAIKAAGDKAPEDTIITIDGKNLTIAEARSQQTTLKNDLQKATVAYAKDLGDLRSNEMEKMSADKLIKNAALLKYNQIKDLLGDKSHLNAVEKENLKTARKAIVQQKIEAASSKDPAERKEFESFMRTVTSDEIADIKPDTILTNDSLIARLTGDNLQKLAAKNITGDYDVKTFNTLKDAENGTETTKTTDFYEALGERILALEMRRRVTKGSDSDKPRALDYITKNDRTATYITDTTAAKKRIGMSDKKKGKEGGDTDTGGGAAGPKGTYDPNTGTVS